MFKSLFNALHFFGLFSYSYTLSVTVLTLWVAPPKMFYNWYRIWWSRNQLWNCTPFLGILQGATGSWSHWRTVTTFRYFEQQNLPSVLFEMYFQEVFQQIMTGIVTLRSRLEKELFFFSNFWFICGTKSREKDKGHFCKQRCTCLLLTNLSFE